MINHLWKCANFTHISKFSKTNDFTEHDLSAARCIESACTAGATLRKFAAACMLTYSLLCCVQVQCIQSQSVPSVTTCARQLQLAATLQVVLFLILSTCALEMHAVLPKQTGCVCHAKSKLDHLPALQHRTRHHSHHAASE